GRRRAASEGKAGRIREPQLSVPSDADREIRTRSIWCNRTLASEFHRLSIHRVDAELDIWSYRRAIIGPVGKTVRVSADCSVIVHRNTSDLSRSRSAIAYLYYVPHNRSIRTGYFARPV